MTKLPVKTLRNTQYTIRITYCVLLLLVGFGLRLYRLGADSLWYDETVSAYLANQSITDLIAHTAKDIHPPGYYLLLHLWTGVAGRAEFALAFFSVIFGVLLIALTYRLACYLTNPTVAAWAALLTAVSPYHLWYSQEVRMYTLGAALGLGATYCVIRALAIEKHDLKSALLKPFWLGYIICAAAGLYVLYYFAFLLVTLNLVLLLIFLRPYYRALFGNSSSQSRMARMDELREYFSKLPAFIPLLLANMLVVVAYLPWLPVAWQQAVNPPVPPWRSSTDLWSMLLESWSALSFGQSVDPAAIWPLLLLTLGLFTLGLYQLQRLRTYLPFPFSSLLSPLFLPTYTFGPLLLIYLFSFITPLYHVRYVFTYAPAFYIVLGAGLAWLMSRRRWLVLATALLLAGSFYSIYRFHFDPRYRPDNFRAAVKFIQNHWQPGDVIMTNAGYTYTAFVYYSDLPGLERRRLVPYNPATDLDHPLLLQTGSIDGDPTLGWGDPSADFYAMTTADTLTALDSLSGDFYRLWVLRAYDTVTDSHGLIRNWLRENAVLFEDEGFTGESNIRVQGFLLGKKLVETGNEPVYFEDGLALTGWALPAQTWSPGQTVYVKLAWLVTARPHADYKMSLKLWNETGQLIAQGQDDWPGGTLYRTTRWRVNQPVYQPASLSLPLDLPPGRYWLNVELYHPDTVQPLPRLDGQDPVATLGLVEVH